MGLALLAPTAFYAHSTTSYLINKAHAYIAGLVFEFGILLNYVTDEE